MWVLVCLPWPNVGAASTGQKPAGWSCAVAAGESHVDGIPTAGYALGTSVVPRSSSGASEGARKVGQNQANVHEYTKRVSAVGENSVITVAPTRILSATSSSFDGSEASRVASRACWR